MNKALDFLEIQKQALMAGDQKSLGFIITNQTHSVLKYDQAIFWTLDISQVHLHSVSGNSTIDEKGPYAIWLIRLIKRYMAGAEHMVDISESSIPAAEKGEWETWAPGHLLLLFLKNGEGEVIGGLVLQRANAFSDADRAVLEELKVSWQKSLELIRLKQHRDIFKSWKKLKGRKKYLWSAAVVLAFFPVRMSITAPAEIVAQSPMVASVPYAGIIKDVLVDPGASVSEGQVLAEMERDELIARAQAAKQALDTATIARARLSRQALVSPDKKADLNILQSEIEARQIEYDYAQTMLERSQIKAPRAGLAVFSDKNSLQGKPASAGEVLMEIAAPENIDLLVRVPVGALIPFSEEAKLRFYLNASPLHAYHANIKSIGYQASPDPDGLLTYKVRAHLPDDIGNIRIGWKGTAKIYGSWTILSYSILRRPLVEIRRLTGL